MNVTKKEPECNFFQKNSQWTLEPREPLVTVPSVAVLLKEIPHLCKADRLPDLPIHSIGSPLITNPLVPARMPPKSRSEGLAW